MIGNHIQLKRLSLEPNKYGNDIKIRLVTALKDGKYIKHVKIDEKILTIILDFCIPITNDELEEIIK